MLDDEDSTIDEYKKKFSSDPLVEVVIFCKQYFIDRTDTGLTIPQRHFAVFARNAVETDAIINEYPSFFMFDDDITTVRLRYVKGKSLKSKKITANLDKIFELLETYLLSANLATLGFGTANNYMGGACVMTKETAKYRMCYNAFLRNAKFKVDWFLNILEDRTTSIFQNRIGNVWIQFLPIQIDTMPMYGVIAGGNSEVYKNYDKFRQVFFPILMHPDCNYIRYISDRWTIVFTANYICPKIISDRYKRGIKDGAI